MPDNWQELESDVIACQACPRLREHCLAVAATKRRAYAGWDYWGKPVPGFGDLRAWLWIVGLAPGAHGANRTGRIFTGDRSGDFLYAALHRAALANQPTSVSRDDGLKLNGCFISASARCAPPDNKPSTEELHRCAAYLDREWNLLRSKRIILALGRIAWDQSLSLIQRRDDFIRPVPQPNFAHGAIVQSKSIALVGSYHVSQQNTFTGRLTPAMLDSVVATCRSLCDEKN